MFTGVSRARCDGSTHFLLRIFSGLASSCLFLLFTVRRWDACIGWSAWRAWPLVCLSLAISCSAIIRSQPGLWAWRGLSGPSCAPQSTWLRITWSLLVFRCYTAQSIPCILPPLAGNSSSGFLVLLDDFYNSSPSTAEAPSSRPHAHLLSYADYRISSSICPACLLYLFS